ncbi:hypothetical protein HCN44_000530 [Aphidius gifuensis]|uniref:Fe2OG dioxygenase domain-containing protein n=1 Tax=Aphidius gifuensis TaxID=684658 RepID=A0A835CRZ2_APHGI|nr:hypothetical protein HCN44_000530 [Aphidius gifuensis]
MENLQIYRHSSIFVLNNWVGLIFIRNPFTSIGQRYWITKCLRDYSRKPNKLNIDAHDIIDDQENWWSIYKSDNEKSKNIVGKLRWATLGYHHNWDTKYYSENDKSPVPYELNEMTKLLSNYLGFNNFNAEAAIVNYYRMNSTLAGHVDHSENNMDAPLFSISFGQTAIFLIGGLSQQEPAYPIYIKSGDVIVMSGESRLRYHGVPKILRDENLNWKQDNPDEANIFVDSDDWNKASDYIDDARININIRQVLKIGQTSLTDNYHSN